jgi:SOS response associated peptidase (SRAP)
LRLGGLKTFPSWDTARFMCGRFGQRYTWSEVLQFLRVFGLPRNLQPHYNIAPTMTVDVIRLDESGRRELVPMRWGLIPAVGEIPQRDPRDFQRARRIAYCQEGLVARQLAAGTLKEVLKEWSATAPGFHIYYPSRRQVQSALHALISHLQKRMARPVCKGVCRDDRLISLLQRIRPRGYFSGHDGDTRAPVLIKLPASNRAIFFTRLPERRSTVGPSRRHPLANILWRSAPSLRSPKPYAAIDILVAANRSPRRSTAQAILASLLAKATIATLR